MHDIASYDILVTSDFNVHLDDCDDRDVINFVDLLNIHKLVQHVEGPTHDNEYTLDLVITRSPEIVSKVTITNDKLSDHFSVKYFLPLSKPIHEKREVTYGKLNQIDFEKFSNNLQEQFDLIDPSCDLSNLVSTCN